MDCRCEWRLRRGGLLQLIENSSAVNLAAGKTMTIQNGGRVRFTNRFFTTASNAIYNVSGTGSTLETINLGSVSVGSGAQLNVSAGGSVTSAEFLDVALTGGDGTLVVDGVDSSAVASYAGATRSIWGYGGHTATVTFSNSATGTFNNGLSLANNTDAGTTAMVNVLSGADLSVGPMGLATLGGATTSATLNVEGGDSTVTQTGASTLTVGHVSTGTAVINIGTNGSGASFTTGTGLTEIRGTGTVNVGGGANSGFFNVNGDIAITSGDLNVSQISGFVLAAGKTMNIVDGGRASFGGPYNTASNAVYNVAGTNSRLETVGGGSLTLNQGAQVHVSSGGLLSSASILSIGNSSNGTLTVDGAGSSVTAAGGGANAWGSGGGTATVVFSNQATGSFSTQINLAPSATSGTTANVTIESGADLTAGGLTLAASFGATTSATLTVEDPGSTVTLNPSTDLIIGSVLNDTAVIHVQDGGALTVGTGGNTILRTTGTINIDFGFVDLKTLDDQGGAINFTAGSLSYLGDLTVDLDGLLGSDFTLTNAHQLTLSGTTTVAALHTLTLNGGTFSTGALVVNGTLAFGSGTLNITGAGGLTIGAGGPLGSTFTLGAGRTLNVTSTTTINSGALVVLESGAGFTSGTLANNGELALDRLAATANAATVSNAGLIRGEGRIIGNLTNNAAGEIRAEAGNRIKLQGANGTNAGKINLQSGTAEFTQPLTNGATGQIIGRGTLIVGGAGLTNNGHVAFSSGISDVFGGVNNNTGSIARGISISGNADVTFWDDVTNGAGSLFRVSAGSSATFFGTFAPLGSITGTGDVYIEADLTPGASPASVDFGGNMFLGTTARLKIELGGTTLGSQYDHVEVAGTATLDGTLDVSLINGFAPNLGNSFKVLHAGGGVLGVFADELLPSLAGFLNWNPIYASNSVFLTVVPTLAGDYNANGVVDSADYVVWRKSLGQIGPGLPADGNNDNQIDSGDFNVWRAHFGQTAGSGSVASANAAVPEPAIAVMLMFAAAVWCLRRCRAA